MEKINIAELLKNCPQGMELDCTMYDNVVFEFVANVKEDTYPIKLKTKNGTFISTTEYGCYDMCADAKCIIFPKGKTTWEGFIPPGQFKDGDIVAFDSKVGTQIFLFKEYMYDHNYAQCYMMLNDNEDIDFKSRGYFVKRFATKEEKEKLFKAIKEHGYEWNTETKTLEKLPKFKIGDTISNGKVSITINYIDNEYYCEIGKDFATKLPIKNQDEWNLISEKFPNRFNINTLIPFESRVLVRAESDNLWKPAIFGCYVEDKHAPYYVLGGTCWSQCIPYEGNEHLRGKTDDCDEYFKTWK